MNETKSVLTTAEKQAKLANFKAKVVINSPGRVNLIGEHTDYNNGFVMPTAIDKKITFYLKANGSASQCNVTSLNYDTSVSFDLNKPNLDGAEWTLYIIGVIEEIKNWVKY